MDRAKPLFAQLQARDPSVREAAQRRIAAAVAAHGGDARAAAAELGISVRTTRRWTPAAATAGPRARSPFPDFTSRHRLPLGAPAADPGGAPGPAAGPPTVVDTFAIAVAGGTPAPTPPGVWAATPAPTPELTGGPFGAWPHHQPEPVEVPADLAAAAGDARPRRLAFVLHAHLPWVLGHGTWPHGEDWLAEAVVHCYLPLVSALERLAARGGRDLLAFSVSPVLAAQLADPRCGPLVAGYLEHRLAAARRLAGEHPLAAWWESTYDELRAAWEAQGGDLIAALRRLGTAGAVELSTCAATHGYLPLLQRREHIALQLRAASENHRRWFGSAPAGLWMPECAYRPGGPWRHPASGASEPERPGNEEYLAAAGLRWTVVDAHLLLGGEPLLPYSLDGAVEPAEGPVANAAAALAEPPLAARLQPHRIGTSPLAAMVREPHAAQQVWSRHGGYPGDPRYLDFHKRQAETGLRLWRVTDAAGDLGDKLPYHPADAAAAAREHAGHFLDMLAGVPGLGGGVAACPYDAELFGHWWFEGPQWLEEVLARCLTDPRVTATTPSRELAEHPPHRRARLLEGSWGEAGDHRVWLNESTAWMWQELGEAEAAVAAELAGGAGPERGRAALAQLLLLAASDWPFLVTAGTAADYARERFRTHADRLRELLDLGDGEPLPPWAGEDLAGLALETAWWADGP